MSNMPESIPDAIVTDAHLLRGPSLSGYEQFHFSHNRIDHPVYHRGDRGHPPILLLSELAGFAPGLLMFADRLVQHHYQVYLPWMFGSFAKRTPLRNAVRLCVSREFARLKAGVSAPITDWLRALSLYISVQNQNARLGAIGMCLTGAFVIPLIIDPQVKAAVAAQPSTPLSLLYRYFAIRTRIIKALNVSDEEIIAARQRLNEGEVHMFACRFRADRICPSEKLERLQHEFPIGLEVKEYGGVDWRNSLNRRPHATFTKEFRIAGEDVDDTHPSRQAFRDLICFLDKHLRA